jgi:hypothetical protein
MHIFFFTFTLHVENNNNVEKNGVNLAKPIFENNGTLLAN